MRFGLFLAITTLGIVAGTEAHAAAGRDYEVAYYKEYGLKTQVGTFYKPCGTGAARLTGRRTPYFTKSQSTCRGGGGHSPPSSVSCHFTQPGCTDALARVIPKKPRKNVTTAKTVKHPS
ncbi:MULTISPECIES: hypothetical protein [Rhizobium]|uniref:hypothetical protein n=1 Tax=Rhizobium TaxID=379 RepID=UPI00195995C6|nr:MULTISPECIES: hypothetical protein [Rhizobium]MBM7045468.1 hypothetical protein [Rhizobium lusitanum]